MPEATLTNFSLENKTPAELEQRRREIVQSLTTDFKGFDDPAIPLPLLQELAVLTGALRRKNAGPPKKAKAPRATKGKLTTDDLLSMI